MGKDHIILILLFFLSLYLFSFNKIENPLNDEWIYVRSANIFATSGKLVCEGCTTSGLFHVLIGGILIKIFGLSFYVLRILIAFFAALSVILTYKLTKSITGDSLTATLVSLLLVSNPIFFNLSSLYMTDIPFLFFTLLSVYFILTGFEKKDFRYFILAGIISSINIFIRQTAFFIPISLIIFIFLFYHKQMRNKNILISFLIPFVFFLLFFYLQKIQTGSFYSQEFDVKKPLGFSFNGIFHSWSSLVYLGFFFLPTSLFISKKLKEKAVLLILLFFLIPSLALHLFFSNSLPNLASMPYLTNILHKSGLGAVTIPGGSEKAKFFPDFIWAILTILSIFSSTFIINKSFRSFFFKQVSFKHYMLLLALAFLSFTLLKRGAFFDRNLIVFIPLLGFLIAEDVKSKKLNYIIFSIFILFLFSYSVIGQTDYLEWNKARYDAINSLLSSRVDESQINGGFEQCLFKYGMKFQYEYWKRIGMFDFNGYRPHDWQFCPKNDYIISFNGNPSDLPSKQNYQVYKTLKYCIYQDIYCSDLFILKLSS